MPWILLITPQTPNLLIFYLLAIYITIMLENNMGEFAKIQKLGEDLVIVFPKEIVDKS